jgi:hypothetical protein
VVDLQGGMGGLLPGTGEPGGPSGPAGEIIFSAPVHNSVCVCVWSNLFNGFYQLCFSTTNCGKAVII